MHSHFSQLQWSVTRNATLLLLSTLGSLSAYAARPSIADLQAQITELQSQVTSGTIPNVAGYVTIDTTDSGRPTIRVSGANLQVVNGSPYGNVHNGLGNILVGYDEPAFAFSYVCSNGDYQDEVTCTNNGFIWAINHKSGSHNVVIGPGHRYSSHAGLVVGWSNTINNSYAFAAGTENTASGSASFALGGHNSAMGFGSGVSGGAYNVALGNLSSVSGGYLNRSAFWASSVTGGYDNLASGDYSTVSGGRSRSAIGINGWRAGGLSQAN